MTNPPAIPKMPKPAFILAIAAFFSCSAASHAAPIRDLDGDGIPNISDRDVDNDGIPNKSDRNVDGGLSKKGLFKGKYIGDRLNNDSPKELDIDDDGRKDDAFGEKDIDGDGIEDQFDSDVDGDGRKNSVDDDIDGDGRKNKDDRNVDGDDYKNADDIDVDGDGLDNDVDPDIDGDGIQNSKDPDKDGDGIRNKEDEDETGSENTGVVTEGVTEVMPPQTDPLLTRFPLNPITLPNGSVLFFSATGTDKPETYHLSIRGKPRELIDSLDGNFTIILEGVEYRTTLDENGQPVLLPPLSGDPLE